MNEVEFAFADLLRDLRAQARRQPALATQSVRSFDLEPRVAWCGRSGSDAGLPFGFPVAERQG